MASKALEMLHETHSNIFICIDKNTFAEWDIWFIWIYVLEY